MILLSGGTVCDPESASEVVADVLIVDGRIAQVAPSLSVPDAQAIDVTGLMIGPGFVDLHSHVHAVAGHRLQAMDGVTTALDLEMGMAPVGLAYRRAAEEGRPLNYGFSASWTAARGQVLIGQKLNASFPQMLEAIGNPRWQRTSSASERAAWLAILSSELEQGALGIGVLIGYAPDSDPGEYMDVARLAASVNAPTFTHVRELVEINPNTPLDGTSEVTIAAAETGAAMHHCHVNSTSGMHIDRVLATLEKSRQNGTRVTLEAYPYGAGSTAIGAAFLDPDHLRLRGQSPQAVRLIESGRKIADEAELRHLRATDPGLLIRLDILDEDEPAQLRLLRRSLSFPESIIASDATPVIWEDQTVDASAWPLPPGGKTHPRTAGTYTKSIRTMVREQQEWSWADAFRRCSFLPARVLDGIAPSMTGKGRIAPGADADVIAIDPNTVTDRASFTDSTATAVGVRYSFVGGHPLIVDGNLRHDSMYGQAVRGHLR